MRRAGFLVGLIGFFLFAVPNLTRGQSSPKLEFDVATVRTA